MRRDGDEGGRCLVAGTVAATAVAVLGVAAQVTGLADVALPCGVTLGRAVLLAAVGAWLAWAVPRVREEVRRAR